MITLSETTLAALLPPPSVSSWDWICKHVCNKRGLPFDHLSYPWTRGICEEWDNPRRERLFFQAGSRLGKTEIALALLECSLATAPDIAMIGGPTDKKVTQWLKDRLIPMITHCGPLHDWLPPPHRRPPHTLHLRHATIYGAWSGSPTTLGDLDPKYLLGLEIDKFSTAASDEADSLMLLLERGAEIPNRRVLCESTPTIAGKSRIDKYVRQGTNCRFHVPCPRCGRFQELELGRKGEEFGLIWDHEPDGSSDPNTAYRTARYRCRHCFREIDEDKRFTMVQRGVWCPHGCMVNKKGKLKGTMENDGPDASFQLSRMYGPTFTFSRYARAFVEAAHDPDPEALRSFKNNWEGVCWSPSYNLKPWEEIAQRLCTDRVHLRKVPDDGQFITMGVDVQVDHWVYQVMSWTKGGRGSVINYGLAYSWDEIAQLIRTSYEHMDDGPPLRPMMTLVDARDGNRTDEVTAFCRTLTHPHGPWVLPCMGSRPGALQGKPFSRQQLDTSGKLQKTTKRRGLEEFYLITVATNYYQNWVHNALNRRGVDEDNSIAFPSSSRYDEDYFQQLLSEYPEWDKADKCVWVKKTEQTVNDFRDAMRYARCAADVYTAEKWDRIPRYRTLNAEKKVPGAGIPQPAKSPERPADKVPWVRSMRIGVR